jgi:hypothetical protein
VPLMMEVLSSAAYFMFNLSIRDSIALLGSCLLLTLIVALYRREERKRFPCFFLYLIVVLFKAELVALIKPFSAVPGFYAYWFYSYWIGEAVTILLSFTVIYEVYRNVTSSTSFMPNKMTFFRINVGLLLMASIAIALAISSQSHDPLTRTIYVLSNTLRIMQLGMFTLLTILSVFYGFFWTDYAFGIALGYGLYALSQLANNMVRVSVGSLGEQVFVYVSMLGYDCAVMIWLVYALTARSRAMMLERVPENRAPQWIGALERGMK